MSHNGDSDGISNISPRMGHSACIFQEISGTRKLLVFGGGEGTGEHSVMFNDAHSLDIEKGTWTKLNAHGDIPSPRYAHTATVMGMRLVIFGGFDGKEWLNDELNAVDSLKWTCIDPRIWENTIVPHPRYAHTATSLSSNKILVFGGASGKEMFNDCWILNTDNFTWKQLHMKGHLPIPRLYHTSVLLANKLYVFGGKSSTGYLNDFFELNLSTRKWTQPFLSSSMYDSNNIPVSSPANRAFSTPTKENFAKENISRLPPARAYHAAAGFGNTMIIFGGYNGTKLFKDWVVVDIASMKWYIAGKSSSPRCKHTASLVGQEKIIVFGGHDGLDYVNKVLVFDCAKFSQTHVARRLLGTPSSPNLMYSSPPRKPLVHQQLHKPSPKKSSPNRTPQFQQELSLLTIIVEKLKDPNRINSISPKELESMEFLFQTGLNQLSKAKVQLEKNNGQGQLEKNCRFGTVEIREYDVTLGGGGGIPSDGPGIGLGWEYVSEIRNVDSFELNREAERINRQEYMKKGMLSSRERTQMVRTLGHTNESIDEELEEIHIIKHSRDQANLDYVQLGD